MAMFLPILNNLLTYSFLPSLGILVRAAPNSFLKLDVSLSS
nr:MAG TPA: hypothetical protein [Bacteriophage sp.]